VAERTGARKVVENSLTSRSWLSQQTITTVPLAGMNEPLSYDQDSSNIRAMMRSEISAAQTSAKKRQM
jgi:hypothetical protein